MTVTNTHERGEDIRTDKPIVPYFLSDLKLLCLGCRRSVQVRRVGIPSILQLFWFGKYSVVWKSVYEYASDCVDFKSGKMFSAFAVFRPLVV